MNHQRNWGASVYRVGHCIEGLANRAEGCMAMFIGGVLFLHVLTQHPTYHQRKADYNRDRVRLALFTRDNVISIAVKVGALDWQDAPYTPHLDRKADLPDENTEVLQMVLVLVDSFEGRILAMRTFGLSRVFTVKLMEDIKGVLEKPFDRLNHLLTVVQIQNTYTAHEIGERMKQAYMTVSKVEGFDVS